MFLCFDAKTSTRSRASKSREGRRRGVAWVLPVSQRASPEVYSTSVASLAHPSQRQLSARHKSLRLLYSASRKLCRQLESPLQRDKSETKKGGMSKREGRNRVRCKARKPTPHSQSKEPHSPVKPRGFPSFFLTESVSPFSSFDTCRARASRVLPFFLLLLPPLVTPLAMAFLSNYMQSEVQKKTHEAGCVSNEEQVRVPEHRTLGERERLEATT